MDRQLNRINAACMAADRITEAVQSAGFSLSNPDSIMNAWWDCAPDNLQYAYGASRLVIWDTDYCDYVIKIPLDKSFEKYCQHEVEVYNAAVEEGLSEQFAWCMCYSEPFEEEDYYFPGIYVMEYMDCNEEAVYDSAWKHGYEDFCYRNGYDSSSYDAMSEYNNWKEGENEELILDYMESLMSPEYRRAFEVFMCKWWITDIHEGNVSLMDNGQMVIVDYAGWNW